MKTLLSLMLFHRWMNVTAKKQKAKKVRIVRDKLTLKPIIIWIYFSNFWVYILRYWLFSLNCEFTICNAGFFSIIEQKIYILLQLFISQFLHLSSNCNFSELPVYNCSSRKWHYISQFSELEEKRENFAIERFNFIVIVIIFFMLQEKASISLFCGTKTNFGNQIVLGHTGLYSMD